MPPRQPRSAARSAGGHPLQRRMIWAMARLRSGQKLTAGILAREFEISERTAFRDLDALRDYYGAPMAFDPAGRTFRLTEPTALVAPMTLSRGELVAMFFAERTARQYRGTPFEADLRAAVQKIREMLPEEVAVAPEALDEVLSLDPGPVYSPDPTVFREVLAARRQRRVLVVRYRSLHGGSTRDRRLHPYHVYNHRGDWYVAAWDEGRRAVRDFALHRIRRATISTERYEIDGRFNARAYLGAAFGIEKGSRPVDVSIRFSPLQARWIRERKWHATARVQGTLDGGCVLRVRVPSLGEIQRWILQFGAEAEVLAPAELRTKVAAELERARAHYGRANLRPASVKRRRPP